MHKKIIVTSNYTIEELFKDSGEDMIKDIKRRFKVTVFCDHAFNGNRTRPLCPIKRGLREQAGVFELFDTDFNELTTGLWDFNTRFDDQIDLFSSISVNIGPI